jgi:ATP-dependent Lon protease
MSKRQREESSSEDPPCDRKQNINERVTVNEKPKKKKIKIDEKERNFYMTLRSETKKFENPLDKIFSKKEIEENSSEEESSSISSDFCDKEEFLDELPEDDMILREKFETLFSFTKKRKPTLEKILNLEYLSPEEQEEIFLLYWARKNIKDPNQKYEKTKELSKKILNYKNNQVEVSKYSKEQHELFTKEIKEFNLTSSDVILKYKILSLTCKKEIKEIIYGKYLEYLEHDDSDDNKVKLKGWLSFVSELPHDKVKNFSFTSERKKDLTNLLSSLLSELNKELFGLSEVKEQLLLFVNAKMTNPNVKKCGLALIGPPGVGKTTIVRLLSKVLEFPFEQLSFGGMKPDTLLGHDYTYTGAQPGEVARCLRRMKCKNGILFLDEFEKASSNPEMVSCLLHMLDPSQNSEFKDKFVGEFSLDLSELFFVYSMNSLPEDKALADRLFCIEIPGYTYENKIQILMEYILPKALKNLGLTPEDVTITPDVASRLVCRISPEDDKGVRNIERSIGDILNKLNFLVMHMSNDFQTFSFAIKGKYLSYPIELTDELLLKLVKEPKKDLAWKNMYM